MEFKKGSKLSIPIPENHIAFLYLLDGKLTVDGFGLVDGLHAIVFKKDGDTITIGALEDTRTLLMTGKPLDEEVVSHGPFVMNTQQRYWRPCAIIKCERWGYSLSLDEGSILNYQ